MNTQFEVGQQYTNQFTTDDDFYQTITVVSVTKTRKTIKFTKGECSEIITRRITDDGLGNEIVYPNGKSTTSTLISSDDLVKKTEKTTQEKIADLDKVIADEDNFVVKQALQAAKEEIEAETQALAEEDVKEAEALVNHYSKAIESRNKFMNTQKCCLSNNQYQEDVDYWYKKLNEFSRNDSEKEELIKRLLNSAESEENSEEEVKETVRQETHIFFESTPSHKRGVNEYPYNIEEVVESYVDELNNRGTKLFSQDELDYWYEKLCEYTEGNANRENEVKVLIQKHKEIARQKPTSNTLEEICKTATKPLTDNTIEQTVIRYLGLNAGEQMSCEKTGLAFFDKTKS